MEAPVSDGTDRAALADAPVSGRTGDTILLIVRISDDAGRGALCSPTPPRVTGCERGYAPLALSPVGCSIGEGLLPTEQVGLFWWKLRFLTEQIGMFW